jgi:Tol biopolymer transport system component
MEQYVSAEEAFQRALELNPESAKTYFYLGLLIKRMGDPRGESFLQTALRLDDDGTYHATLGYAFNKGSLVEENQTLATHWLVRAAQMGNRYAESETGRRFLSGEGTTKDYRAAHYWTRMAAERGDTTALYRMGFLYERGLEVYRDYFQAAHWYWKSAKYGDHHGRYSLGLMYESGRGVDRDLVTAYLLTQAAASNDNEEAAKFLPRLQMQMTPEQHAEAERRIREGETGLEKTIPEPGTTLDPSLHEIEDLPPPNMTRTTVDQIAFLRLVSGSWQLWIMGSDGSDKRQLTHSPIDKVHVAWRPGSPEILYSTANGDNFIFDLDSGMERPVLEGVHTKNVSWSPDGNRLAYVIRHENSSKKALWISNMDGRHRREVLNDAKCEAPPVWLNDDVLVHEETDTYMNEGQKDKLWELAMHLGGAQRQIPYDDEPVKLDLDVVSVPNEWSDTGFSWKLAYASLRSGFYELWAYDLVDKWPRQITHLQAYAGSPTWSPDGRYLAFDSDKTGVLQVYRVNENGEELVQLTTGEVPSRQPTWSR